MLVFIYCVLLFGFRYRVGVDTLNYMYSYDTYPTLDKLKFSRILEYQSAPLYTMLCVVCRSITGSFYLLQMAVTLIFNTCLFVFLRRYSSNPFLTFGVFFVMNGLYFNTEIMKESLAIGFFLLNTENLLERRWIRYFSLAFVSLGFHYSAAIVFVIPFFVWLKFDWKFLVLSVVFVVVSKYLAELIRPLITLEAAANRVDEFAKMIEDDRLNVNFVIFAVIHTAFIPFCLLVLNKKKKIDLGKLEFLICLCVIFGLGCIYLELIFERFSNYLAIVYAVAFADMLHAKNVRHFIKLSFVTIFIVIYGFSYVKDGGRYHRWYPYHSILNEVSEKEREQIWFEQFGR